jgi:hypothetical protein
MTTLQSASPLIAWHLRGATLTGATGKWGGSLSSRAQVEGALWSIDGLIVLLELAGYTIDFAAFAVATTNVTHRNADAVVLHLPALTLSRGIERSWPALPDDAPRGRFGLWVQPRQERLPGGLWLDGCMVNLHQELARFAEIGVGIDFSPTTDGWLTLPVARTNGWVSGLTNICDKTMALLSTILGDCVAALGDGEAPTRPGCGLLALLDPAGWQCGDPAQPATLRDFPRTGAGHQLAADVFAQFTDDPAIFLLQEVAFPLLTANERLGALDSEDSPAARWAALIHDIGGIDGSPGNIGELRPEFGDLLSWTHMLLWAHELGALDALSAIAAAQSVLRGPVNPYGDYVLRRGDSDRQARWGGQTANADDPRPDAGQYGFVRQLQIDLQAVGIRLAAAPNGEFDVLTELALREYEIAARFTHAARRRADAGAAILPEDTLEQVEIPVLSRLTGPILGTLEPEVAVALRQWVAADWCHPVVLYAVRRGRVTLVNLWRSDEVKAGRVWAWDCSGQYSVSAAHELPHFVGRWSSAYTGGPATIEDDAKSGDLWAEVALTPETLVGPGMAQVPPAARVTDPTWSTYRVLAAVGGVEMINQFDALNAYDPGVISIGLFHWILGGGKGGGELGALLALLRARDLAAFESVMGRFGLRPTREWGDPLMFDKGLGTYNCSLEMRRADGLWDMVTTTKSANEKQWFRGWCWFYRLQMACRTNEPLRRVMWEMGRLRIRDMLALRWPGRDVTFAELFTSERLVAMILRWHVNRPADLQNPESRLVTHGLPAGSPANWSGAEDAVLEANIVAASESYDQLKKSIAVVRDNETLAHAHKSFYPDWSGL